MDGSLEAAGFVPLDEAGAWSVDATVGELRLTDALRRHGVPVPTTARGRVRVEGPRADPTARFEVEAHAEPVGPRPDSDEPSFQSFRVRQR